MEEKCCAVSNVTWDTRVVCSAQIVPERGRGGEGANGERGGRGGGGEGERGRGSKTKRE
jgi:hypothetical protein